MIPDFEISKCPEFEAKSKIGTIFKKHNPLEEYSVSIYEIDLYFYEIMKKKKIQTDENGRKYILIRIDVYFNIFLLAVEIDEKGPTDSDLTFEEKDKKQQKKNLVVNLLELMQVMQKMVMIQIMRLVTQKNLLMSLKTDNQKKKNQQKKIKKKSTKKIK